jgi:hypothetical protein
VLTQGSTSLILTNSDLIFLNRVNLGPTSLCQPGVGLPPSPIAHTLTRSCRFSPRSHVLRHVPPDHSHDSSPHTALSNLCHMSHTHTYRWLRPCNVPTMCSASTFVSLCSFGVNHLPSHSQNFSKQQHCSVAAKEIRTPRLPTSRSISCEHWGCLCETLSTTLLV